MITKREAIRYEVPVPISITTGNDQYIFVPKDISIKACYFNFPRPFSGDIKKVKIMLSKSRSVQVRNPELFEHEQDTKRETKKENGSFGIIWELGPGKSSRLQSFLESNNKETPQEKKAEYIIEEQKLLANAIENLEKTKFGRLNLLFTLIVAYLAYFIVPYKFFQDANNELISIYALGGIWISICLVFYADRLLRFIGSVYKNKALFYKAINLNRAYLFKNDGIYYSKTIFPIGIEYDTTRSWTYEDSVDKKHSELHPGRVKYNPFTSSFIIFIQLLFVLGFVYYGSLILRALEYDPLFIVKDGRLNMIRASSFYSAFVWLAGFIILWIQVCLNECEHFQAKIWEVKRISVFRPNAQFLGKAFAKYSIFAEFFKMMQVLIFSFGVICFFKILQYIYFTKSDALEWFYSLPVFKPQYVALIIAVYIIGKFAAINMKIAEETKAQVYLNTHEDVEGLPEED